MKKDIFCVGTAIVDCIVRGFDPVPVSATGYVAQSATLNAGGEAVNQSVMLSKLGMHPHIVCGLGTDPASDILLEVLRENNVDTAYSVRDPEMATPVTVMFIDENGDRRSITNSAHRHNFRPDMDLSWIEAADAVSIGSLFRPPFDDPEIVYAVVSKAAGMGVRVYADTKLPSFRKVTLGDFSDSLPLIECITPNRREAEHYSGETYPDRMAEAFLKTGVKRVIVKLGEEGCLYRSASKRLQLPAYKVDTVDATGAGDCFLAGFITAECEGKTVPEALAFANLCGALSTRAVGATSGIRDRAEIEELLDR